MPAASSTVVWSFLPVRAPEISVSLLIHQNRQRNRTLRFLTVAQELVLGLVVLAWCYCL